MKIGVIADDFTGASDIALMLRSGGMRVSQFVGIPENDITDVDVGVISLKTRTCPTEQAVTQSLHACSWLIKQGAQQIIFKVCSTFDSTDEGNIGPVAEALANELDEEIVVVCPAFPANNRTVYQAHLFVGDRLLNESGMEDHPLTPMRKSDLRQILAPQTSWNIGHIPLQTVRNGPEAIVDAFPTTPAMMIADAVENDDLKQLAKAVRGCKLLVGGSGIALGLPSNFELEDSSASWNGLTGPSVILSGSCSKATREQIQHYLDNSDRPNLVLEAQEMVDGKYCADDLVKWALSQSSAPLIYSSADPAVVKAAQEKFGRQEIAGAFETFFSKFAQKFVEAGGERIIVAGGETSGAVVEGLQLSTLEIGPEIAPGVPAMRAAGQPLNIALKSGNFGQLSFFDKALTVLGESHE